MVSLIKNSKYKIPPTTHFKQFKATNDSDYNGTSETAREVRSLSNLNLNQGQAPSDLQGHDLMFAKIAFSVNRDDFENFIRKEDEDEQEDLSRIDNDEQYLIF